MGTLRGIVTLALIIAFTALVVWLFVAREKKDFDDVSRIPLDRDGEKNE